jgi:hypothetical protein
MDRKRGRERERESEKVGITYNLGWVNVVGLAKEFLVLHEI